MLTFVADLHLSLSNRIDDFKRVLIDQVLPMANRSTRFYILGDIFHNRRPHPVELNVFRDFITKVSVPTIIVLGNHDINLEASTIDELRYYNTKVQVYEPPMVDICGDTVIYLDHDQYEGAKIGASNLNLNIKGAKKVASLPKTADSRPIDFYIFGHIHKAQTLSTEPPILYVGSIEHVDFAERAEDKYVFQIDEKTKKYGYKKLNVRPMVQIDIDLNTEHPNVKYLVPDGAIVKVVITGTKEQVAKFNEGELRESLKKSLTYKILYNYNNNINKRNSSISEGRTVLECFDEYSKVKVLDEVTIKRGKEIIDEH